MKKLQKGIDHIGISCVFYCHDGQGNFLLHKRSRKCKDEKGRWEAGGGGMEFGEKSFEDAARREIMEEYGCKPKSLEMVRVFNILRKNQGVRTHWVAIVFKVLIDPNKVIIGDPDKMDDIGWFTPDNLPSPLHSQFNKIFPFILAYK